MGQTASIPSTKTEIYGTAPLNGELDDFVELPETRNHASRGIIVGVSLGGLLWGVILVAARVIKL